VRKRERVLEVAGVLGELMAGDNLGDDFKGNYRAAHESRSPCRVRSTRS